MTTEETIAALDRGEVRVAEPDGDDWRVNGEVQAAILDFFRALEDEPVDVVLGVRAGRSDPPLTRIASSAFWWLYRRFVQPEIPRGGIDVFACNRAFRDHLL